MIDIEKLEKEILGKLPFIHPCPGISKESMEKFLADPPIAFKLSEVTALINEIKALQNELKVTRNLCCVASDKCQSNEETSNET